MEGISIGASDGQPYSSSNIFAILEFRYNDMTGYWPQSSEKVISAYTVEKGIPTLEEELPLSAKCLIKW